jgi:ATP-binding cassette, subfamily B, heavy metal transporter
MPPQSATTDSGSLDFAVMRRFLPYLWPKDAPGLRWRIMLSFLLVAVSKAVQFSMGIVFGMAIDRMAPGLQPGVAVAIGLVIAYASARFGGVLFDNLRNVVFERVGQEATRKLAENVFAHLHRLSLRFHLSRRTGAVTKIIERGTKSIDVMLYFMLFNIAPTVLELALVLGRRGCGWCCRPSRWSRSTSSSHKRSRIGATSCVRR